VDRIAVVNGLRGLAIIGVIFQHMGSGWALDALGGELAPLRPLVSNGWTGVNLFFILSGFVLFLPYAARRRGMVSSADVWHFYRARFLRLMPLYYFAAAVVLVLAASILGAVAFTGLAIDLATMRFAVLPHHFGIEINYPLWSIGVEVLFSLAFPPLVMAAVRIGVGRLLAVALLVALAACVGGRLWDPRPLGANFISDNIFGRIDEFVLGMAVARHLVWPGVALILLAWAGFYQCQYRGLSMVVTAPLNNLLDLGFVSVLACALTKVEGRSVLAFAPLQVIGMMCYSLYIWHAPVLQTVQPLAGGVIALLLVVVLAAFSYRYIEFRRVADWRALFLWPHGFLPGRSAPLRAKVAGD
jgi:peptidoglycan/LPS O-acetylase OafA/YrhL